MRVSASIDAGSMSAVNHRAVVARIGPLLHSCHLGDFVVTQNLKPESHAPPHLLVPYGRPAHLELQNSHMRVGVATRRLLDWRRGKHAATPPPNPRTIPTTVVGSSSRPASSLPNTRGGGLREKTRMNLASRTRGDRRNFHQRSKQ